MKKNKMMRLASALLVLTLLTTCVISGTFAKYVTKNDAHDTARVAKWGVVITAEAYQDDQLEEDLLAAENEIVASASTTELLAPGTGIHFASIDITGTPEVAVNVKYEAVLKLDGWRVENDVQYVPIVFVINDQEYTADTMGELKTLVQNTIAGYSKDYSAGTDLSSKAGEELTVSCYWAFEGNNDANDTYLADKDVAPTIDLTITCTVTQID